MELSTLQKSRCLYVTELPPCLQGSGVRVELGEATSAADPSDAQAVSQLFPLTFGQPLIHFLNPPKEAANLHPTKDMPLVRVGILFSGRQTPGGHNVVCGLYDAIKSHNPQSTLLGFCVDSALVKTGGTEGLFAKKTIELTEDVVASYRNQGILSNLLISIVFLAAVFIICGLCSGYNLLGRTKDQIRTTEHVKAALETCQALTLDALVIVGGIISNTDAAQLAESFAKAKSKTKVVGVPVTLYGDLKNEFVETNVGFDTICKVNAQLISNLCTDALSAEKAILGEEVSSSMLTLFDLTKRICDAVQARAEQDDWPDTWANVSIRLHDKSHGDIYEIRGLQKKGVAEDKISSQLTPWASALFEFLPPFIKKELLLAPESDDSPQLSQIETEKLLAQLVETEMDKRQAMMSVNRLQQGPWVSPVGKPSIIPAAVDLKGKPYQFLIQNADQLWINDLYRNPGPIQFEGPGADSKTISLCAEDHDYMGKLKDLQAYLDKVKSIAKPGCSQEVLKAALSSMASVIDVLTLISSPPSKGQILL
ncbi:hypothetical protein ACLOJK_033971 [Asimina triloba]